MNYNNTSYIVNDYILYESTLISYILFSILLFLVCLCNINCFFIYKSMMNKIQTESNDSESNKILTYPPSYESVNEPEF